MRIIIHAHKTIEIETNQEQSLAKAIWLSGKLEPPPLCSGLGRCGQCKVKFISNAPAALGIEQNLLTAHEIEQGIRLACRHNIAELKLQNEYIEIELLNNTSPIKHTKANFTQSSAKLAIDLGTTSLHWQAIYDDSGKMQTLAQGQQINPQMGAGSDIVSRLSFAMQDHGEVTLAELVYSALQNILQTLPPISEICLAANTAMTGIFLQKPIKSLAVAPYSLPFNGHNIEHLVNFPPIYIPPQLAPFVGGDISAGYAALMQEKNLSFPFIFVDLGTNGEFILALDANNALITSVPLGPALEGIGLTFGSMANAKTKGIVHAVHLSPQGLEPKTIDGNNPERICGTGYLSLLRCLLQVGIVKEDGHFNHEQNIQNPLGRKLHKFITPHAGEQVLQLWSHLSDNIYLSSSDIEEILKVKAAFSLAMQELLKTAQLKPAQLQTIYLGGAMGSHVQGEDLEGLGFMPFGMSTRLKRLGNSALAGAALLLHDSASRQHLHTWSKHIKHVQLAEHDNFIQEYMTHMHFKYTG